jgi:hypothetical protein
VSYHVVDIHGMQVFAAETFDRAKELALQAKSIKLNGCTVYHIEKRDRVWTTVTLDEALRGHVVDVPGANIRHGEPVNISQSSITK